MRDVIRKHGKSHLPGGSDPIEVPTSLPVAYATIGPQTLLDDTTYTLMFLDGGFYGLSTGIASDIQIINDDSGDVFTIVPTDEEDLGGLWIVKRGLYVYDVGLVFNDAGGLDNADVTLSFRGPPAKPTSISTGDIYKQYNTTDDSSQTGRFLTTRMSGLVLIDVDETVDPPSESVYGVAFQVVLSGGNDLPIDGGWAVVSRLTHVPMFP